MVPTLELRHKDNNINLSRQFTQIGAEIIGVDKTFCLSEIINLIIEFLNNLKIKKFIINFSMPNLINLFSKDFNLKKSEFEILMNCYKNKNLSALKDISNEQNGNIITKLWEQLTNLGICQWNI